MSRPLTIGVLGPLEVNDNGRLVAIEGAKPRAVLSLLGLYPGEVLPADRLAEILWGDHPPRTADKALQTHVSTLRRCLGADVIVTRGGGWLLDGVTTDVQRFASYAAVGRAAIRMGDPSAAVDSYDLAMATWRGKPDLPATPRARSEVARWIEHHASVAEDRIDALLGCGAAASLVGELELAVAEVPLRERHWAQLMLALYRAGRQADALAAYRRVRTMLDDQLGVPPGPELRALEAAILRQDPSLTIPPKGRPEPVHPSGTTFVGRERERQLLADVLLAAAGGESRVLLLTGDAGIGKSRLVAETVRQLEGSWFVLTGHCVEAGPTGLPYAPLSGILRSVAATPEAADLLDETAAPGMLSLAGPEPLRPSINTTSGLAQLQLFDALLRLLGRLSERRPTLLIIEDLHLADPSTRAFLSFLGRSLLRARVVLLATVRTDELVRTHPLRPLLAEFARLPTVSVVPLGPLSGAELERLIGIQNGAPVREEVIRLIARRSGGNPFFAEQLLAVGAGPDGDRLPTELADVLLHRVDQLGEDARNLLRVASLAGPRIDYDLLLSVANHDSATMSDSLRECADARLLEPEAEGNGFRFRHALLAEAVAADIMPPERRTLHARFAEALAGTASAALVAQHLLGAADLAGAFAWSVVAAREAYAVAAPADALTHWDRVLELWPYAGEAGLDQAGSRSEVARAASEAAEQSGAMNRAAELAQLAIDEADTPRERALGR